MGLGICLDRGAAGIGHLLGPGTCWDQGPGTELPIIGHLLCAKSCASPVRMLFIRPHHHSPPREASFRIGDLPKVKYLGDAGWLGANTEEADPTPALRTGSSQFYRNPHPGTCLLILEREGGAE